jgi:L-lactate dehydrogenase complex protein LldG
MSGETVHREQTGMPGSSAREVILAAVRAALPPAVDRLGALEPFESEMAEGSFAEAFVAAASAAGAKVTRCDRGSVGVAVASLAADARSVFTFAVEAPPASGAPRDPHELAELDLVVCESTLGVAENGAVWLATSDSMSRAALLLAQRVVVVVAERDLARDMHEAYGRLDVRVHPFGAFVAGPSKTADIEQALVIGAHGPKAFTVLLVLDDDRSVSA